MRRAGEPAKNRENMAVKLPRKHPGKGEMTEYEKRIDSAADILAPAVLAVLSALFAPGEGACKKK